jgi:hypothetical protein
MTQARLFAWQLRRRMYMHGITLDDNPVRCAMQGVSSVFECPLALAESRLARRNSLLAN